MEKETKEKGKHSGKKITQFPTQSDFQEGLEDAEMDRFLRQSIMEEADRLERELNEDPKLIGIGASDDLFGKIVEELKAKGIWEGDKETKEADEDLVQKQGDLGENEKAGTTLRANDLQPIDNKKIGDEDGAQKKENDTLLKADEKTIQEHKQDSVEVVVDGLPNNRNQEQKVASGTSIEEKPEHEEKMAAEAEPAKEEQQNSAVYDMLSEADREALAFGYEMQKKEQAWKEKLKRRNRRLKHVSVAVVALVLGGGIGFSTEASRQWILQMRDIVFDNLGTGMKNNFVQDESRIRIWNEDEEIALENIKQEIGIEPVKLMYIPQEMKFSSYKIDSSSLCANVFYEYKDITFIIYMFGNKIENVFYYQMDEAFKEKEEIITEQNIVISLRESEYEGEKKYVGAFGYNDNYYYCVSSINYAEMKKILKYLIVF